MFQLLLTQKKREPGQKVIVEVYCTAACPYCRLVRDYFKDKGIDYSEFRVDSNQSIRLEMEFRSKRATVPQIFINDFHVGGYDDFVVMDKNRQLEILLYNTNQLSVS